MTGCTDLLPPPEELVSRILGKVGFQDRFTAALVNPHAGAVPVTIYSFRQIANLLNAPTLFLDFTALTEWVRIAIGDEELAALIADAIKQGSSDLARLGPVRDLMQARLRQCEAAFEQKQHDEQAD